LQTARKLKSERILGAAIADTQSLSAQLSNLDQLLSGDALMLTLFPDIALRRMGELVARSSEATVQLECARSQALAEQRRLERVVAQDAQQQAASDRHRAEIEQAERLRPEINGPTPVRTASGKLAGR
jgi:hypothetical protein